MTTEREVIEGNSVREIFTFLVETELCMECSSKLAGSWVTAERYIKDVRYLLNEIKRLEGDRDGQG